MEGLEEPETWGDGATSERKKCTTDSDQVHGNACCRCPPGAVCERRGVILQKLELELGWWRYSENSAQIFQCRHGEAECSIVNGSTAGEFADSLCRPGSEGPLCSQCQDSPRYFRDTMTKRCLLVSCVTNGSNYNTQPLKLTSERLEPNQHGIHIRTHPTQCAGSNGDESTPYILTGILVVLILLIALAVYNKEWLLAWEKNHKGEVT